MALPRVPTVCSFESRREKEIGALIRKFGGDPFVAPSMREVSLAENPEAVQAGQQLLAGEFDLVVFLTGVGATAMLDAMSPPHDRRAVIVAISECKVCVRGPKPAAVMKEWGVEIDVRAPEPNTWHELEAAMAESGLPKVGQRVLIQEYGERNDELAAALRARGAVIKSLCVYRWALPTDISSLQKAVRRIAAGDFDIVMITSAQQIRHALAIAADLNLEAEFRSGLSHSRLASIGPTATAALTSEGIRVDVEPAHPKMGPLVRDALGAL